MTKEILEDQVSDMTRNEAFRFLAELGVPCAPIYEAYEAMFDPHLISRGMWIDVDHPFAGKYKVPNFPVRFSKTPGKVFSSSPILGQHTEDVLSEILGISDDEIERYEKEGIIVQWKE